jgi:hypothetical protein
MLDKQPKAAVEDGKVRALYRDPVGVLKKIQEVYGHGEDRPKSWHARGESGDEAELGRSGRQEPVPPLGLDGRALPQLRHNLSADPPDGLCEVDESGV